MLTTGWILAGILKTWLVIKVLTCLSFTNHVQKPPCLVLGLWHSSGFFSFYLITGTDMRIMQLFFISQPPTTSYHGTCWLMIHQAKCWQSLLIYLWQSMVFISASCSCELRSNKESSLILLVKPHLRKGADWSQDVYTIVCLFPICNSTQLNYTNMFIWYQILQQGNFRDHWQLLMCTNTLLKTLL